MSAVPTPAAEGAQIFARTLAGLANTLVRRPAQPGARSFADALRQAGPVTQRLPRSEAVDLREIVGSVGRAHELANDFRPRPAARREGDEFRLRGIQAAMERGGVLPPVCLYRLGDAYYVLDGHHRVAAAHAIGQLALDAVVTEFVPQAPRRRDALPHSECRGCAAPGQTSSHRGPELRRTSYTSPSEYVPKHQ